jgi:hypothetical protein
MFAIFRVSRGLNGLGDFGVLLFPDRGVPEMVENWDLSAYVYAFGSERHTSSLVLLKLLLK